MESVGNGQENNKLPSEQEQAVFADQDLNSWAGAQSRKKLFLFGGIFLLIFLVGGVGAYLYFTRDLLSAAVKRMSSVKSYSSDITAETIKDKEAQPLFTAIANNDLTGDKSRMHLESTFKTSNLEAKMTVDTIVINQTRKQYSKFSFSGLGAFDSFPDSWVELDMDNLPESIKQQEGEMSNQPLLASLIAIFQGGKGESVFQKVGNEVLNGRKLIHYTAPFASMRDTFNDSQKLLLSNIETVDIWVDSKTSLFDKIIFEGPELRITSIIRDVDKAIAPIDVPENTVTYEEYLAQLSDNTSTAFLPKNSVREVYIGYYGNIYPATIEKIKTDIKEAFGVKVTVLAVGESIPSGKPFFDASRKQYDADALWNGLSSVSSQYGEDVRLLFVTDIDLFTNIQKDRPYVFSRALPNANTAFISIRRLFSVSDTDSAQASPSVFDSRLKKLVSRTLGVTMGLSVGPDASDMKCVMYQFQNIEEMDKTGETFCDSQKKALENIVTKE